MEYRNFRQNSTFVLLIFFLSSATALKSPSSFSREQDASSQTSHIFQRPFSTVKIMSGGRAAHAINILQDVSTDFATRHGLSVNAEGRPHKSGFPLTFDQKVSFGSAYLKGRDDN